MAGLFVHPGQFVADLSSQQQDFVVDCVYAFFTFNI